MRRASISRGCARTGSRTSLELGGKSAAIFLDDADIGAALGSLVPYSMPITGQVCFSLTRVLVPRARRNEIAEAYMAALGKMVVGDPFADTTNMGPLAMERQRDRVEGYIAKAVSEGATLALGGGRSKTQARGFFIEPTVFLDVEPDMTIAREEVFGQSYPSSPMTTRRT